MTCDCERKGAKATHRVLIAFPNGEAEEVIEACPLCVLELLEDDLAAVLAERLRLDASLIEEV